MIINYLGVILMALIAGMCMISGQENLIERDFFWLGVNMFIFTWAVLIARDHIRMISASGVEEEESAGD